MRTITIWQVWAGRDAAQSDSFFPTRDKAEAHIRNNYTGVVLARDGNDQWIGLSQCRRENGTMVDDDVVHMERHKITPTREGLCWALHNVPNR